MSLLAVCLLMHVACLEKQPELAERLQRFAAGLPPHAWGDPEAEVLLPGATEAWEVVGAVAAFVLVMEYRALRTAQPSLLKRQAA